MFFSSNGYKTARNNADACERRWKNAMENGNATEAYSAVHDYEAWVEKEREALNGMDPNSHAYEKAEREIDGQASRAWDMHHEQRLKFSTQQKNEAYERFEMRNQNIANGMMRETERGNVAGYEQLRDQYVRNVAAQERLVGDAKNEGLKIDDQSVHRSKVDILDHDIAMRDRLSEKIREREEAGKPVKEEDRAMLDRYAQRVKQEETALVKYQNERTLQGMRERGASEAEIAAQEEKNRESEKWVESINR